MGLFLGLDLGSTTTKAALFDDTPRLVATHLTATGFDHRRTAETVRREVLAAGDAAEADLAGVVSTGYGRRNTGFADAEVSEIACHAAGAHFLAPGGRAVLDIGGQDSKVIHLGRNGNVADFAMNEKCAAGTGRFLDVMARGLDLALSELAPLAAQSTRTVPVSSQCAVFAESEVISLVAGGHPQADIIAGVHRAVAERAVQLVRQVGARFPLTMTGGVALNDGVVSAIEFLLGERPTVPERAQFAGAIGAALIARKKAVR